MTSTLVRRAAEDDFGLLGPALSVLLRLLNGDVSDQSIANWALSPVSPRELATRRRWSVYGRQTGIAPNFLIGKAQWMPFFGQEDQVSELRKILRVMVDAWIDSGKEDMDRELPLTRNVRSILHGYRAWQCRPEVVAYHQEFEGKHRANGGLPFTDFSLRKSIADEKRRRELGFEEARGGHYFELMTGVNFDANLGISLGDSDTEAPLNLLFHISKCTYGPLYEAAFSTITRLLLLEDERAAIAKCRRKKRGSECGRYFLRAGTSPLKKGAFCGAACRNKMSGQDYSNARRADIYKRCHKAAAEVIVRYGLTSVSRSSLRVRDENRILRAVDGVRDGLHPLKIDTKGRSRWVGQNWVGIQKEIRDLTRNHENKAETASHQPPRA